MFLRPRRLGGWRTLPPSAILVASSLFGAGLDETSRNEANLNGFVDRDEFITGGKPQR